MPKTRTQALKSVSKKNVLKDAKKAYREKKAAKAKM